MPARSIVLSTLDHSRLRDLLQSVTPHGMAESAMLDSLSGELTRAKIVPPEDIPPYVVTMNTCVHLVDTETGEEMKYSLVYPEAADPAHGRLSILSELGAAIIGFSVGDTIEWEFPDGVRRLRIAMIYFQPEATKDYDS